MLYWQYKVILWLVLRLEAHIDLRHKRVFSQVQKDAYKIRICHKTRWYTYVAAYMPHNLHKHQIKNLLKQNTSQVPYKNSVAYRLWIYRQS